MGGGMGVTELVEPVRFYNLLPARTRPQGGGGGGSTDPKMVVQNNGFCGRQRRWRFCFRHMAGGNFFV